MPHSGSRDLSVEGFIYFRDRERLLEDFAGELTVCRAEHLDEGVFDGANARA